MTETPIVVPRPDLVRLTFQGSQAATVVNGLVTNEVAALTPGTGCYAAALTPKGKIVADLRIFRTEDAVITDAIAAAAPGWLALVKKYVNPRLARYVEAGAAVSIMEVIGAGADVLVSLPAGDGAAAYTHGPLVLDGHALFAAWIPDYGVPALAIWCEAGVREPLVAALRARGAREGTADDVEGLRVATGWPRWGIDMDEGNLAQEANMDDLGAISYTKGCYTGQEFVARLHYRGHVNKHLRGLHLQGMVDRGAEIRDAGDALVGDVRSVARGADGAVIALAMLRREVPDQAPVTVRTGAAAVAATVVALPFGLPGH